jgi:GNAT superfamily N-acetyltransferase
MAASRNGDPEAGPADPRMAGYLEGLRHPREALPPRTGYVALEGDRIVGYITGHLTRRYQCDGEIQYLYVAPPHRRTGVATGLLRELFLWFKEQDAWKICVDVEPDNAGARAFYGRNGAVPLNRGWMVWNLTAEGQGVSA